VNRAKRRALKAKQEIIVGESFAVVNGCVPFAELEAKMGSRWDDFCDFMQGQTVCTDGVYVCDVETFLRGLPVQD